MTKIAELVTQYREGEITFDALLTAVPTLEWGQRHEEVDGEIWWEGENTVADVGVLYFESLITDEERQAIVNAIP